MKKKNVLLILFFLLVTTFSCNDESQVAIITDDLLDDSSEQKHNRNIDDIKQIIETYVASDIFAKTTPNYDIDILTNDKLDSNLTEATDTLLYSIKEYNLNQTLIVSANKTCEPILVILDNTTDFSFDSLSTETESVYLPFILNAIEYNNSTSDLLSINRSTAYKQITRQVLPKLNVEWAQTADPFNRYSPNKYPAGCVPIAIAQVMTFLRTMDSFDETVLNWAEISSFKNHYETISKAPEADIVGQFIRYIGKISGTTYKANVSSTDTYSALNKVWSHNNPVLADKVMVIPYTKDRENKVESTLDSEFGIYIVSARNKGSIVGFERGSGHAFVVDGYRKYSDGSSYLHVNYGWGPGYNGYFLTNILNPSWTDDAPEKYPYEIIFYNISVMYPSALSKKIKEKDYLLNGKKRDIEFIQNYPNVPEDQKAIFINKILKAQSITAADYIMFDFLKMWGK